MKTVPFKPRLVINNENSKRIILQRKDKDLRGIRSSSYYGYWLRLKSLGFTFSGHKTIARGSKIIYIENYWWFRRDEEIVLLMVSRRRQKLVVKIDGETVFRLVTKNPMELEEPFLNYFGETEPLFIRRLGPQPRHVKKWQDSWVKHIKDRGKWAKRLKELGVFNYAEMLPVAKNVRPVKKGK